MRGGPASPRVSGAREGSQGVAALAGAVGEAGGGPSRGAVAEGEWYLPGLDAGGEPVEGHADLGPEAGCDAGQGIEGRREECALTGEWLGEVASGAPGDAAAGQGLHEAEAAAASPGEGRDGDGMLVVEGRYQGGELRGARAEIGIREEQSFGGEASGTSKAHKESVPLPAGTTGRRGDDHLGTAEAGDLGREIPAAVVHYYEHRKVRYLREGDKRPGDALGLVAGRNYDDGR